jgi:hypothetical protein
MKHLMRYDGYTSMDRVDDILDKISKYGITALSNPEKEFLDAYSIGQGDKLHEKMSKIEYESVFEDDYEILKFELEDIKRIKNKTIFTGVFYTPDIKDRGKKICGRLKGEIILYKNGNTSVNFSKKSNNKEYDIFEFCNGIEYELDKFVDYIVSELKIDPEFNI